MKPFEKDLFSVIEPVWSACKPEVSNQLSELAKMHLSDFENLDFKVFQVGGLEINSSNFWLKPTDLSKSVVLKKWPKEAELESIQFHNELLDFLNQKGVPSPPLVQFKNEADILEFQEHYWTAQTYTEGIFFNGNKELIPSLVAEANKLQLALSEFQQSIETSKIPSIDYDIEIIDQIRNKTEAFKDQFEPKHAQILIENWTLILEEHQKTKDILKKYSKQDLCHLDLHPHNILVNQTKVLSFLDFDSAKFINRPIAMAYFALKNCKQICSLHPFDPKEIGSLFKAELSQSSSEVAEASAELSSLANAEVIRRICIILRLTIMDQDKKWNHVLPLLINHLKESKQLFD